MVRVKVKVKAYQLVCSPSNHGDTAVTQRQRARVPACWVPQTKSVSGLGVCFVRQWIAEHLALASILAGSIKVMHMSVHECSCVYMCVCERERERERESMSV